ncbi:MAG: hypothetical protein QW531_05390, partial [Thermoplasmata archaeon]
FLSRLNIVINGGGVKGARATYGPWLEEMRALAQSLNVDYVINSQLGITIVGKGVVRKKNKTLYESGCGNVFCTCPEMCMEC